MSKGFRRYGSPSETRDWDELDVRDIESADYPDRINFYNEPDYRKTVTVSHKPGRRRRRRRASLSDALCLWYAWSDGGQRVRWEESGRDADIHVAYPRPKHDNKVMYARRGYRDSYFGRRLLRREELAHRAARRLKQAYLNDLTRPTGGIV